jgi:hypothetical protein
LIGDGSDSILNAGIAAADPIQGSSICMAIITKKFSIGLKLVSSRYPILTSFRTP